MLTYSVSFLLSLVAALMLTPLVRVFALRTGAVDRAGLVERKTHTRDTPRLGGIAIVVAFYLPLLGLTVYPTEVGALFLEVPNLLLALLLGGLGIAALGIYDDFKGANAWVKLSVQTLMAILVIALDVRIEAVNLPIFGPIHFGLFAYPLTLLWIVGLTNAVNLIDGLDGLAAGVALFGVIPVLVIAVTGGTTVLALIACCLAGALLGFLAFNFHPARIFMGDTGSMFLGFVLAVATVRLSQKGTVTVSMLTPILALGLPIIDTLLTVARRAWSGAPIFRADRGHIHHRLLDVGLNHRQVVVVLYLLAAALASAGLAVHFRRAPVSALSLVVCALVAGILMRHLSSVGRSGPVAPSVVGGVAVRTGTSREQRDQTRSLRAAIKRADSLVAALSCVDDLAGLAGACKARLVLAPVADHEERVWTWVRFEAPSVVERLELPLAVEGVGVLGTLELLWPPGESCRSCTLPLVEFLGDDLAEALEPVRTERAPLEPERTSATPEVAPNGH
jgi:UDP-GlcNAc:undecaprenyl-phosphate/decaprenyl-phosphate GlcNAc-1-phosphate transferase